MRHAWVFRSWVTGSSGISFEDFFRLDGVGFSVCLSGFISTKNFFGPVGVFN